MISSITISAAAAAAAAALTTVQYEYILYCTLQLSNTHARETEGRRRRGSAHGLTRFASAEPAFIESRQIRA